MAAYYVNTNAQSNGDHEVHRDWCYWLSLIKNPMYLGYFDSCLFRFLLSCCSGSETDLLLRQRLRPLFRGVPHGLTWGEFLQVFDNG